LRRRQSSQARGVLLAVVFSAGHSDLDFLSSELRPGGMDVDIMWMPIIEVKTFITLLCQVQLGVRYYYVGFPLRSTGAPRYLIWTSAAEIFLHLLSAFQLET
jgi:hypothetical protein